MNAPTKHQHLIRTRTHCPSCSEPVETAPTDDDVARALAKRTGDPRIDRDLRPLCKAYRCHCAACGRHFAVLVDLVTGTPPLIYGGRALGREIML